MKPLTTLEEAFNSEAIHEVITSIGGEFIEVTSEPIVTSIVFKYNNTNWVYAEDTNADLEMLDMILKRAVKGISNTPSQSIL